MAGPFQPAVVFLDRSLIAKIARTYEKVDTHQNVTSCRTLLCLPQIKPEHIGDAVHPGSDGTECVPLPRRHVKSARPCSTISECEWHCSSPFRFMRAWIGGPCAS